MTGEQDHQAHPERARRRTARRSAVAAGLIGLPLAGSLFVTPTVSADQAAVPVVPVAATEERVVEQRVAVAASPEQAFIDAGYSYEDAMILADLWGLASTSEAKAEAGSYLAAGTALLDSPRGNPGAADGLSTAQLREVFYARGYNEVQAQELADRWGVSAAEAEAEAGTLLTTVGVLAGIDPGGSLDVSGSIGMDGVFFRAGYDYADAELLAAYWGLPTPYDAKVQAGMLIEAGQPLPDVDGVGPS